LQRHSPSIVEQTLMSIHALAESVPAVRLSTAGSYALPPMGPPRLSSYLPASDGYARSSSARTESGATTIIERQNVLHLHVTRPMNIESEFAGLDAWANAGR
jgi:hypothetical protein